MTQFIAVIGIIAAVYFLIKETFKEIKNQSERTEKIEQFKSMYGEHWGDQFERMLDNNNWMDK